MSVSHHLTDETIQDYSAGGLTLPMETLVACHLTMCSSCRARAELADGIGAQFFEEFQPASVSLSAAELIARAAAVQGQKPVRGTAVAQSGSQTVSPVNTRFDGTAAVPAASGSGAAGDTHGIVSGVPRPLGRLLPTSLDQLPWRRIAPGIKRFNLSDRHRRHGAFQLLHLEPGVVLSAHSHQDRELTFLVQGSYCDELGRFQTGDIADLDGQHLHQPVVDSDVPCIALIATHSPVRYSGMLGKIMQPFVGI